MGNELSVYELLRDPLETQKAQSSWLLLFIIAPSNRITFADIELRMCEEWNRIRKWTRASFSYGAEPKILDQTVLPKKRR